MLLNGRQKFIIQKKSHIGGLLLVTDVGKSIIQ